MQSSDHCLQIKILIDKDSQRKLTYWGWDKISAIFQCIFLNENVPISIDIPLKFVHNGLVNNIPALLQMIAWHQSGENILSEKNDG